MSAVKELYDLTTRIYEKIKQPLDHNWRDEIVAEIMAFVNERDTLIKEISPPYSDEEVKIGRQIVQMDQEIQKILQSLFMNLKGSMKQIQNKKQNNKKYVNPYKNVSTMDGMFFDKRN